MGSQANFSFSKPKKYAANPACTLVNNYRDYMNRGFLLHTTIGLE